MTTFAHIVSQAASDTATVSAEIVEALATDNRALRRASLSSAIEHSERATLNLKRALEAIPIEPVDEVPVIRFPSRPVALSTEEMIAEGLYALNGGRQ